MGHLIVTRKLDEGVVLNVRGERARIYVSRIEGDRVRLGIQAPNSVSIHRDELLDSNGNPRPDAPHATPGRDSRNLPMGQ